MHSFKCMHPEADKMMKITFFFFSQDKSAASMSANIDVGNGKRPSKIAPPEIKNRIQNMKKQNRIDHLEGHQRAYVIDNLILVYCRVLKNYLIFYVSLMNCVNKYCLPHDCVNKYCFFSYLWHHECYLQAKRYLVSSRVSAILLASG